MYRICTPGCLNDGVCAEDKCICRDGFEGDHCEKEGRNSISLQKPIFQTICFLFFILKVFLNSMLKRIVLEVEFGLGAGLDGSI